MGQLVVSTDQCTCTFGTSPASIVILPAAMVNGTSQPAGTIMDNASMVNIPPFGMCQSLANPQVASATAAASGVLTPQPCLPVIAAPWAPGSATVMIGNKPALNNSSKCMCNWGGSISITSAGQGTINIP